MGYEQLPPEVPMWSQDSACENCEKLNERIKVLEDAVKYLNESIDVLNSIRSDDPRPRFNQWNVVFAAQDKARAALEVKP
jgi:hypothetical protein